MTSPSLETQIDQLYQLPLAAFTSARNTLAKTLKGADASRIKQLGKPTVVPWTVNQLYWHARSTFDRLFASGRRLREVQIAALKGRTADVRRATEDHRAAIAEAVREGNALAAKQGAHPAADQLARMLETLSVAESAPNPPGRLTEVIQPSGFEALAAITPSGRLPGKPAAHGAGDTPPKAAGPRLVTTAPAARREDPAEARKRAADERRRAAEERRREQERAAARAKAEARVRTAERDLSHAQEALHRAERATDEARRAVQEAERALATARGDAVLSSPHV